VDYFNSQVKASSLPGFLPAAALAAVLLCVASAHAQDAVVLKSGVTREGKITGAKDGSLRLQMGAATTGIPIGDIVEVRMAAPPEFDAAAAQLARGDAKGAVAALQKINADYAGLPAAWAERAAAMLGDAKLAAGDAPGAKEAYAAFSRAYPQATALANLGLARLAVDGGQFDEAGKLLAVVLAKSATTAFPEPADGPPLCQGHYLMGRVREAGGDKQAALEHYLTASAVFPFDRTAATEAQTRADKLRSENAGLIAP
jgi:TolA-binding protein